MNVRLRLFIMSFSAFTLGLYASSQFKFQIPIEPHRWAIMSFFFVFSLLAGSRNQEQKNNEPEP